ncbi:helix-turn-helix domain-containing protein [Robertkochia solimangrovi]|uniref:helix-turn-helix domain-containing protein n=1 Tax=Robertkochia solimangrovi TaxID=2213046 RepID=UPI001181175C|nr:helix-turn-helix domain-containing protein [Robertkochia solimangrovi]TRZ44282.1 hypothetical protein DMZ48_07135 [Robertkochia solimangrovi]
MSGRCDMEKYAIYSDTSIADLTADDTYALAKCELEYKNYHKAYSYFQLAKKKGCHDIKLIDFYIQECLIEIGKQDVAQMQSFENSAVSSEPMDNKVRVLMKDYVFYLLQLDLLNVLFMVSAFSALMIALVLLLKFSKKNRGVVFLSLFLICIGQFILEWDLNWANNINYVFGQPVFQVLVFMWAPLFYLYLKYKMDQETNEKILYRSTYFKHFSLFAIILLGFILRNFFEDDPSHGLAAILNGTPLIFILQLVIYQILSIRLFRNNLNKLVFVERRWYLTLLVFFVVFGFSLSYIFLNFSDHITSYVSRIFVAICFSLFTFFVGLSLLLRPKLFMVIRNSAIIQADSSEEESNVKYKNSGLTKSLAQNLKTDLLNILENERIYLDSEITLNQLAEKLNSDRYSVSQVINQEFNRSFYELLNDYRVRRARELLRDQSDDFKVLDIAFKSGFSNRVSFNKAFKKRTGKTPSEYVQAIADVA